MSQLFQSLQPYFTIILIAALIAAVYFSGRYKPIGRFYATVLYLPGLFLHSLATFLKPFDVEQKPNTSPDPGLRTIVLVIASIFAIVATLADGFLTLQALVVLTDDNSVTIVLPASLSWLTVSQGWLLLSLPAITGIILLDTYFQVVPLEARIFNVPPDQKAKEKFDRFILITFFLSLAASIVFNALKPFYMLDSASLVTLILRIIGFVVTGALLGLVMALTIFIVSLALHAVLTLALTILWFLASMLSRILAFLVLRFSPDEELEKHTSIGFHNTGGVGVNDVSKTLSSTVTKNSGTDTASSPPLLSDQPAMPFLPDTALLSANGNAAKDGLAAPSDPKKDPLPKPEKRGVKRRIGFFSETIPLTPDPVNSDQVHGNHQNGNNHTEPVKNVPVKKAAPARKQKAPASLASNATRGKASPRRGQKNTNAKTQSSTN